MNSTQTSTTTTNARDSIKIKIKENKYKIDACTLYKSGQIKIAREHFPEYIQSLEQRHTSKSDFILGIVVFLILILVLVYYILPKVNTPQLAVTILVVGVLSIYFAIEYTTKQIRISRSKKYLEEKEMPRLKREIDTQRTSIEVLKSQEKNRQERDRQAPVERGQAQRQRKQEERRRKDRQRKEEEFTLSEEDEKEPETFSDQKSDRFERPEGKLTIQVAFKILDVPLDSKKEDVRRAYRDAIIQYHPDRVAHLADEFKVLAEERSKLLNEAYELLKRKMV
ncbi:MAG: DnaJ domain-containing protein [Candidatus Dadabacteria bacterium]|nr:DnaJ domain-containing protein [Candidatus Dadabacteria bacterium]